MLGLNLKMFTSPDDEKAFLQNENVEEQATLVLNALLAHDAATGQTAAVAQPATTMATAQPVAQPTAPAAQAAPMTTVPAGQVQPQPMAGTPGTVQPFPTQMPAQVPAAQPMAQPMAQPAAQPAFTPPAQTAAAPAQVVGATPGPGAIPVTQPQQQQFQPPAAFGAPPQQQVAQPQPMAQPQPQPMAQPQPLAQQRQPSTMSDPSNAGAVPAAQAAPPGSLPTDLGGLMNALKGIQEELETCAGVVEVSELKDIMLGHVRMQKVILILLLEIAEPTLGAQKAVLVQLVNRAIGSGEPEKWFSPEDTAGKG
jgi:hypothetical protein